MKDALMQTSPELLKQMDEIQKDIESYKRRSRMNKGEMIKTLTEEGLLEGSTDTAIPLAWANQARELGIDVTWYVWNYGPKNRHGAPYNLAELYINSEVGHEPDYKEDFILEPSHGG